ncbi:MAG: HAD-IB family hydrolase [Rhabdochlamydiaceae bacterium]|nr:HAD-IB family hydrolase [Rhabdochlamydiaceae bacterium]
MKFSVFDLDRTLISKNSSFEFCKYLYKNRIFSFFFVVQSFLYCIRHKYFGLTLEQLHHSVFRKLLRGMSLTTLSEYVYSFVEKEIESLLYQPAIERLRLAQHEGHFTMILSNSPGFLVGPIASKLQVDDWRASEYKVDKDQRLCQIALILHGETKAFWVRAMSRYLGIQEQEITAYSDSYLDLPFLQSAGVPVVVNPDSKLKKISKEKSWEEI